jgi:hypothetical protein
MRERCLLVALMSLFLVGLWSVAAPAPVRRPAVADAEGIRLLGMLETQDPEAAKARIKFVVRGEDGKGAMAFAGNELKTNQSRWARIKSIRAVYFHFDKGKAEMRWTLTSPEINLEFDKPIRSIKDLRGAKLRTMKAPGMVLTSRIEDR